MSTPEPKKDLPKLLEFKVEAVTGNELTLKVKNISGTALEKTLAIEIYPLMSLVSEALNDAATKAPDNEVPPGALSLKGIVTGPNGWSLWARRESSDSTAVVVLINDRNQDTGSPFKPPVAFPAASETTIRIPLNPKATKDNIQLAYSYTHGGADERRDGTLDLNSTDEGKPPEVFLYTTHPNPTMVKPGDLVQVLWTIKDGVSATLFGPLPGDNAKMDLDTKPNTEFKLEGGTLTVRVVGLMNYVLQAEVKRDGKENLLVRKMLTLDTANNHHVYINPRQRDILPYGLIELDWAAWGVSQVTLRAGSVTTRVIKLTQQTFGGSFEGNGVMRLSAPRSGLKTVSIEGAPDRKDEPITIVKWQPMTAPDIAGIPLGLAMVGPKLGLLTYQGLYIAEVGRIDPSDAIEKLPFVKKTDTAQSTEWIALTAVGNRFLVLRRTSPELQVAAYDMNGTADAIPPINLHPDVRRLMNTSRVSFDFVGFRGRAYVVIEASITDGRRAYSVAFNSSTNKAEFRPEPLLESLPGYRLITFDDALYAVHRDSGRMFRFELTTNGTLGPALQAASAVRKYQGRDISMIASGLMVPVGRALLVINPTSVPTLESLQKYDLHNVLRYESSGSGEEVTIPQDLFYTPQKNYWGRCGHGLDVKPGAVAIFREDGSPRLWVIQADGKTDTLAVGSEALFVRDYVLDFPTKPLSPYINKKRKFTIKHSTAMGPVNDKYLKLGIMDVVTFGPRQIAGMPNRPSTQFDVEIGYNEANPAPVTIRVQLARRMNSNPDADYLLEVSFSGPNLSTVSSCINRVVAVPTRMISNEEVAGSKTQHSADAVIEVPKPARLDEHFGFMIVNSSQQFRVKTENLRFGPTYVIDKEQFAINSEFPGFTLKFDGRVPTEGVVTVDLNFALRMGIEVLGTSQPQTQLVRIANERAGKIQIKVVTLWKPGDPAVQMEGTNKMILPESPAPVFICQLDYKM